MKAKQNALVRPIDAHACHVAALFQQTVNVLMGVKL